MPVGTVVCAARGGTVVALRQDSTLGAKSPKFVSAGNFVVIRHDDGTFAVFQNIDAQARHSFPLQFRTRKGTVETLKAGEAY